MKIETQAGCSGDQTNFTIKAGETVAQAIQFFVSRTVPLDLSGYTLKSQINFPTPLLLTTENGGITIIDAELGKVQINIDSETTADLPIGCYPYDLWTVSGGGEEKPWLCGTFSVVTSITPVP